MKGQRKEVNTATTHIAIRLKKGGAGKGQTRFEVLINRSAYPGAAAAKKKEQVWDMKEIVDEIFTNSAKLEPADKNLLDQCFPNKTKKEIILEILEKGEAQTSEVDRAQESHAQTEYYSQVAAAVANAALMQEEQSVAAPAAAAAKGSAAAAPATAAEPEETGGKKGKKSKDKKDKEEQETTPPPQPAPAAANTAAVKLKWTHVSKDIVEREMKNARFKLIPGGADKVSLDEQVNAAFLALSKNAATIKIIRDQRIMVAECEKQQDAQDLLHSLEEAAGKKPWKVLKTVTDKKGTQTLTILCSADIAKVDKLGKNSAKVALQKETHIPTSEDDDLSRFVPEAPTTVKTVASAPAAAAAATKEDGGEGGKKGGKKEDDKKEGKKGKKAGKEEVGKTAPASLEDELAALTKKGGKKGGKKDDDESSSSGSESEDEAPKMMVNKKKR